jgi:hypothetical protein
MRYFGALGLDCHQEQRPRLRSDRHAAWSSCDESPVTEVSIAYPTDARGANPTEAARCREGPRKRPESDRTHSKQPHPSCLTVAARACTQVPNSSVRAQPPARGGRSGTDTSRMMASLIISMATRTLACSRVKDTQCMLPQCGSRPRTFAFRVPADLA